jgi:hypothetical protein
MVTVRTRIIRIGFILGLLAILVSGISLEPSQAIARPASTGGPDGTPYGNGDPTGDDIPSPTPKPTALKSGKIAQPTLAIRGSSTSSVRWNFYLSLLIRLGIR